jgi:hypothetical protein
MFSNPYTSPLSTPSQPDIPQTAEPVTSEKHNYGQMLKSSALIGDSSVLNIVIGIIRTHLGRSINGSGKLETPCLFNLI